METKIHSGDAGYSLYENVVIQAQSRTAYHISGGRVSQGSDTSQITVAVEPGEASINDQTVSWAFEEVILPPGGESASGPDTNDPRVDVVYAKVGSGGAGALDVAQGVAAPFAPDTKLDESGNRVPYQPGPMEHWQPSPNDGSRVGGVVLALVLVEGGDSVASDVTNQDIKNFKVGAAGTGVYVRGDGVATGPVNIAVDNDPVTMTDESVPDSGAFFEYDPATNEVVLGTNDAEPTLGAALKTKNRNIVFDSHNQTGGFFSVTDTNPNASGSVMTFSESSVSIKREINQNGQELTQTKSIVFDGSTNVALDLTNDNEGIVHLWDITGPGNEDTWVGISSPGTNVANPPVFVIANQTAGKRALEVFENYTTKFGGDVDMDGNVVDRADRYTFGSGAYLRDSPDGQSLIFGDTDGNEQTIGNP